MILFETTLGDFKIEFFEKEAPISVANFRKYVEAGFFDGSTFHRIVPGFVIQGGGFTEDMVQKKTQPAIKNEADNGLKNKAYTVAMARTPNPHSASSQFFINVADNDFLNFSAPTASGWGYCVFGKVVEGTELVDEIRKVRTGNKSGHQDVPLEDVIIERAEAS